MDSVHDDEQAQPGPAAEEQAAEAAAAAAAERRARKKKSRWGAETEVGLKVLAGSDETPQQADQKQADEVQEPASKKRRSRYAAASHMLCRDLGPAVQL